MEAVVAVAPDRACTALRLAHGFDHGYRRRASIQGSSSFSRMKLTLQLSCYNGARYLPHLFASLNAQTFQDWRLVVLDNASHEADAQAIREAMRVLPRERAEWFRVHPNIGFAGAHSYLFDRRDRQSEYVALLNDDAILEPTYLETLVRELDTHAECGAVEGIIYRWNR
mgnify:CR=1 FL=1